MVRLPHSAACASRSAIAGRAGPSGASAMTTVSGPSIVAAPGGHLPDLGALGMDERHFLQLEGGLEGGRVAQAASGHEQMSRIQKRLPRSGRRAARRRRCLPPQRRRHADLLDRTGRSGRAKELAARSSSVATRVDEKVFVMTGTVDGPPAERRMSGGNPGRASNRGHGRRPAIRTRPLTSSATATTSLNSPDDEMPTMASAAPRATG